VVLAHREAPSITSIASSSFTNATPQADMEYPDRRGITEGIINSLSSISPGRR
jgi:TolB-like protein